MATYKTRGILKMAVNIKTWEYMNEKKIALSLSYTHTLSVSPFLKPPFQKERLYNSKQEQQQHTFDLYHMKIE